MKRNLSCIAVLLLIATVGFGQSIKDQLAGLQAEAAPLLTKREANKATLADLNKTKDDIDFGYATLTKYVDKYKTDRSAYDIDLGAYTPQAAALNSALDAHNANQCKGDGCGWYDAEANQLNARRAQLQPVKDSLDSRKQFLDTTLGQLRELQSVMQAKYEKYTADAKAYNAQNDENEAKIQILAQRWQDLLAKLKGNNDECFAKIPPACQVNPLLDDKCEQMHAACGKMFDGN